MNKKKVFINIFFGKQTNVQFYKGTLGEKLNLSS